MVFRRFAALILFLLVPVSGVFALANVAPTAVDDSAVTAMDTAVVINVAANDSDVDGNLDPTSAAPVSAPTNGAALGNSDGTISYTPNAGFTGMDGFDYQICDTDLACSTATVTVYALAPDAPPMAQNDVASTDEDTPVDINVVANDIDTDLDPSSVSIMTGPANGTALSNGDGTVTYTPAPDYYGPDNFDYQVCDLAGNCASATVSIDVMPVNDAPVCDDAAPSVDTLWPADHRMVDVSIMGVTDVENDPITIVITGITQNEPDNGTGDGDTSPDSSGVGSDTAQVRAERAGGGNGRVYEISFTADDGNGGSCDGSVMVLVPHDQSDASLNTADEAVQQPGDFGCDHPGNYCNAPGHSDDSSDLQVQSQSNNHGNGNNNGNNGHSNNGNNGNGHSNKGKGHKK